MSEPKRVIIITDTGSDETRRLLLAIAAHERQAANWQIHLDEKLKSVADPSWLFDKKWDGVIVNAFNTEIVRGCLERRIPCIDINDETPSIPGAPKVRPDNEAFGHIVAEHFSERGYENFAYCGFSGESWSEERMSGFLEATQLLGSKCEVFETPYRHSSQILNIDLDPDWDKKECEGIKHWLKSLKLPTAIMAPNDQRAIHLIDASLALGLQIPNEIAIVGTNNNSIRCELRYPSISSIPVNAKAMGKVIVDTLNNLMKGEVPKVQKFRIEPLDVVVRQSSDSLAISDPIIAKATNLIRKKRGIDLQVEEIAEEVHSSRSQLERGFRKHLGHSPQAEIRRVQISYVKQLLLNTELSANQIALKAGFKHPEYMNVVFKKVTGETPGAFRSRITSPRP